MHINYLKVADKLRFVKSDIETLMEVATGKTFEDRKAYAVLDNLLVEINGSISWLEHYSKPAKEGYLQESCDHPGKYEICNRLLSCGSSLEV